MTYKNVHRYSVWDDDAKSLARFRELADAIEWALAKGGTQIRSNSKTVWRAPKFPSDRALLARASMGEASIAYVAEELGMTNEDVQTAIWGEVRL